MIGAGSGSDWLQPAASPRMKTAEEIATIRILKYPFAMVPLIEQAQEILGKQI